MCGRFTLRLSPAQLTEIFQLLREPEFVPRFNIAPTQSVAAIRKEGPFRNFRSMRWGLIPSWSKDAKIGSRLINARSETIAEKPSFRSAFKKRRCLIPADGFYEWKKLEGNVKQPFFIGLRDDEPFAFAGLWEQWIGPDQQPIESCTVITTEANDLLAELHNRMPVILREEDYDSWLASETELDDLHALLVPFSAADMRFYPVSKLVNSPKNDMAACVDVVESEKPKGTLFD